MTIEPNQYKDRPVLPTPFQITCEEDKRKFSSSVIPLSDDSPKKAVEKPIPKSERTQKNSPRPKKRNNSDDGNNYNRALQRPKPPKK